MGNSFSVVISWSYTSVDARIIASLDEIFQGYDVSVSHSHKTDIVYRAKMSGPWIFKDFAEERSKAEDIKFHAHNEVTSFGGVITECRVIAE